ncbi:MAG: T9SS type A sorting domain-containing protein [Flavipsychrobacter sp.]
MKLFTTCKLFTLILVLILTSKAQAQSTWQHSFGGSDIDVAYTVQPTSDGYIFAGWTFSSDSEISSNHGSTDIWVVKTDINGNVKWSKTYGGTSEEKAYDIQLTSDGGYIVAGYTYSIDGDITSGSQGYQDVLVMKISSSGSLSWEKTYGGSDNDIAYSIQQTGDGGYIVGGTTYSNNGDVSKNQGSSDMWLLKLDNNGNKSWEKTYGGSAADAGYAVQITDDGGYILAGATKSLNGDVTGYHNSGFGSDYWVVKADASGSLVWEKTLGGTLDEEAHAIREASDGSFTVAGYSYSNDGDVSGNHGVQDMWVANLDPAGSTVQWQTSLGGSQPEYAYSLKQNTDGTYIVAGSTQSSDGQVTAYHGGTDYWAAKLDISGKLISEYSFGGANDDIAHCIAQTSDGGFIIAGETKSTDGDITQTFGNTDAWLIKILPALNLQTISNTDNNIQVYPTVTKGNLNVSLPQEYEHASIRLIDMLGTQISINETDGLQRSVHISNAAAGVYLLQIANADKVNNFRIIYNP